MRFLPQRDHIRRTLRLALPVVTVQLGLRSMGLVDTLLVGHVSADALASVALGGVYDFTVLIFGMGILMSLDPLVSQAMGAKDEEGVALAVQRGLVLALALTIPSVLLLWPAADVLLWLGQPPEIAVDAGAYSRISALGALPFYVFVVLRQTLQARHEVRQIVLTIVAANVLNAALDWVLIYGHLGFEGDPVRGTSWATAGSRAAMAALLLVFAWPSVGPCVRPLRRAALRRGPLKRMLEIGGPIAVHFQLEFVAFAVIAVFMGWIGKRAIASHHVALTLASTTFMVPLGVSSASAVLVGNAIGRGDADDARRSAGAGMALGVGVMAIAGVVFLTLPEACARIFTSEVDVILMAATFLPIAGVFQVFDGAQVVASGVLRGAADTGVPMVLNLMGFWAVGLPASLYLGFVRAGDDPVGLWWGLAVGVGAVAVLLSVRIAWLLRGEVRRVET